MTLPPSLRTKLLHAGYSRIEIGDIRFHLATGKITRKIMLDNEVIAEPEFPSEEIDWDIVEAVVS